jgi:hypothetical protein
MKILELRTKTLGSFFACFLFLSILGNVAVAQNGRTFVSAAREQTPIPARSRHHATSGRCGSLCLGRTSTESTEGNCSQTSRLVLNCQRFAINRPGK